MAVVPCAGLVSRCSFVVPESGEISRLRSIFLILCPEKAHLR